MQKNGKYKNCQMVLVFLETKFIIVKNQKNKTSEYIKVIMRSSIKKMMLRHVVYIVFTGNKINYQKNLLSFPYLVFCIFAKILNIQT